MKYKYIETYTKVVSQKVTREVHFSDATCRKIEEEPSNGEIRFVGQILDNVHGFISYTEAEKKIMDTQLFKRLQSIKQLSVVNWVFPGSEHTRFIHSLGVMHIADKMAISMGLSNKERRLLRLAGLLHDIGHYPLSHVGEMPYLNLAVAPVKQMQLEKAMEFCRSINQDVVKEIKHYRIKRNHTFMKASEGLHHECAGALIVMNNQEIRDILTEELGPDSPEIIADIITGNVANRDMTDPLWVQIMHSELDADGIDYIMRDSASAGTNFGACEIEQLIRCLTVATLEDKTRIMCVKPKGIPAADQYLVNKFFHYSQVVFNRHIVISEIMAMKVIGWMRQHDELFPSTARLEDWLKQGGTEEYLSFTDDKFWAALSQLQEKGSVPPHIKRFCRHLLRHDEPTLAKEDEIRIVSRDEQTIQRRLMESETFRNPSCHWEWITALEKRTMSKQLPSEQFIELLEQVLEDSGGMTPELKHEAETRRLMECITVKDRDGYVRVLCDHERSIMQDMYNETVAILRSYKYLAK